MSWLLLGQRVDGTLSCTYHATAAAAHRAGKDNVRRGAWDAFTVARVTSRYERGAVRCK